MSAAKSDVAVRLIRKQCSKALRKRIATNNEQGLSYTASEMNALRLAIKSYSKDLASLQKATQAKTRSKAVAARERIMTGFPSRLVATLRASEKSSHPISFAQLETWANELSMSKPFHEPFIFMPHPKEEEKGAWRPIGMSGPRRKAQQLILRDILSATYGDSPHDSTVKGSGGERALFETLHAEIANGYHCWASVDIRKYFPSLRPGHLAGFPFSQWIIQNLVFLPPETPIKFVDLEYGIELDELTILQGNDDDLPNGYPYTMDDIRSKLKMVRQGLIQGDVCAPHIARLVLGRELRLLAGKRDVVCGSHLDNILIGARTEAEAKASIQALTDRLKSLPAGPLELHQITINHIDDDIYHLGYRVSRHKDGGIYVRPALKRFDRFRKRLRNQLANSAAYEKHELLEIGVTYAKRWFPSHPAWTKSEEGWDYVMSEVHLCVNQFIHEEFTKGTGNWHIDDIDFAMIGEPHQDAPQAGNPGS